MAFSFSGRAARAGVKGIEETLAARLREEFLQQQQDDLRAARERDDARADEQLFLTRQQMREASEERRRRIGLEETALKKAEDKEAEEKTARIGMTEIMGRLGADPSMKRVLAEHAAASGVEPSRFTTELLTPKEKQYETMRVRGPNGELILKQVEKGSPEALEGIRGYTDTPQGPAPQYDLWFKDGKYFRLRNNEQPPEGAIPANAVAKPGTPGASSSTAGITEFLNQMKRLSLGTNEEPGINRKGYGLGAVAGGWLQRGQAVGQMESGQKLQSYNRLLTGFIPMLSRAVGHVGVLTQQDVDSVRELLPPPEMPEPAAIENWKSIEAILQAAQAIELLPTGSSPNDKQQPQINERGLGAPEVDARGNNPLSGRAPVQATPLPAGGAGPRRGARGVRKNPQTGLWEPY